MKYITQLLKDIMESLPISALRKIKEYAIEHKCGLHEISNINGKLYGPEELIEYFGCRSLANTYLRRNGLDLHGGNSKRSILMNSFRSNVPSVFFVKRIDYIKYTLEFGTVGEHITIDEFRKKLDPEEYKQLKDKKSETISKDHKGKIAEKRMRTEFSCDIEIRGSSFSFDINESSQRIRVIHKIKKSGETSGIPFILSLVEGIFSKSVCTKIFISNIRFVMECSLSCDKKEKMQDKLKKILKEKSGKSANRENEAKKSRFPFSNTTFLTNFTLSASVVSNALHVNCNVGKSFVYIHYVLYCLNSFMEDLKSIEYEYKKLSKPKLLKAAFPEDFGSETSRAGNLPEISYVPVKGGIKSEFMDIWIYPKPGHYLAYKNGALRGKAIIQAQRPTGNRNQDKIHRAIAKVNAGCKYVVPKYIVKLLNLKDKESYIFCASEGDPFYWTMNYVFRQDFSMDGVNFDVAKQELYKMTTDEIRKNWEKGDHLYFRLYEEKFKTNIFFYEIVNDKVNRPLLLDDYEAQEPYYWSSDYDKCVVIFIHKYPSNYGYFILHVDGEWILDKSYLDILNADKEAYIPRVYNTLDPWVRKIPEEFEVQDGDRQVINFQGKCTSIFRGDCYYMVVGKPMNIPSVTYFGSDLDKMSKKYSLDWDTEGYSGNKAVDLEQSRTSMKGTPYKLPNDSETRELLDSLGVSYNMIESDKEPCVVLNRRILN